MAQNLRNVALVGHRGSGKTSLFEALLYEAGAINKLGSVEKGTTVSDSEAEEKSHGLSIRSCVNSFDWKGCKINLIDTPGEPSFLSEAVAALSVCDSAVFVVNAVMGVEVGVRRLWQRCQELGNARMIFVNMIDRERADYFRTLDELRQAFGSSVVPVDIPIGAQHEVSGVIDLVDLAGFNYGGDSRGGKPVDLPDELKQKAESCREQLMDSVAENDDDLMERYLEGEEISHDETIKALGDGVTSGKIFPVACGVATHDLGIDRLLDTLVDDMPSPQHSAAELIGSDGEVVEVTPDEGAETIAYVFKTTADQFTGRINFLKVLSGCVKGDSILVNNRNRDKERLGQLITIKGRDQEHASALSAGDIGAIAKLKSTKTGDLLCSKESGLSSVEQKLPAAVMAFAIEPKSKGDEDKVSSALQRLSEEDPTLDIHRDSQTGEQIVAGLSQMHVEITMELMKRRFGAEVNLKPPRVPYQETILAKSKAQGRYKKQTGGRGQFGDCHIEISPLPRGEGFQFDNKIKGGVIPSGFIPAVEKGIKEAMRYGEIAGYPVNDVRVSLFDGSYHSVDSSEMAFKIAGSMAFKKAMSEAKPTLLEPIMRVTISVPEQSVGDVIGDLNGRRGQPLGMEQKGPVTEVKAELPMAELLDYAPQLRSITAGQGDYTMEFDRYQEVPAHISEKIAAAAKKDDE